MLNIHYFKQYYNFNNKNYKFNQILYFLPVFFSFSIVATIIGTAVLNLSIIIFDILFITFYILNKNRIIFNVNKKILLSFLIFLILNVFFSTNIENSIYGFLGIIKNFIFFFGGYFLFKIDESFFLKFIKLTLIVFIFVSADTLLQYFFGKDIFGYIYTQAHGGRLSGPFGDELIVGSFLSKILFISIIFFLNMYRSKIYDIFFLIISISIIFLTNERSAALMAFLSSLIYIFLRFKSLKTKLLYFSTIFLIIIGLLNIPNFKDKYISSTLGQLGIKESKWFNHDSFFDSQWGAHYLTSLSIFKNYPIFGSGLKTFRFECQKNEYNNINSDAASARCSTHPHNFYLEILSDTGFMGIFFFVFLIFFILKKIIQNFVLKKTILYPSIISLFFLFFWPIKTTGSIFSSWNGYFYILALLVILTQINFIKVKFND